MKKLLVLVSLALILGLVLTGCKNDTPKPTAEPNKVNAVAPSFSGQLASAGYVKDATATALNGTATVTDGGTISYQWYSSSDNIVSIDTDTKVGANATYTPPTNAVGTNFYFVVVTNTIADNKDGGNKTAAATGNVAEITVTLLGSIGPGGGTIFYVDSTGAYREVSNKLLNVESERMNWSTAKTTAEAYSSNGYDDWYLPTPAELNQLKKSNTITETATLWSSEEWGYWRSKVGDVVTPPTNPDDAWVYNFGNGDRSPEAKATIDHSARAVRSYSPKKYTTADIGNEGPGGGKIFWVDVATGAYKEISEYLGEHNWYQASGTIHDSHNTSGQYIAGDYTGGGFNDWYLPNISELNEVYTNIDVLSITNTYYHNSSSEFAHDLAWVRLLDNIDQYTDTKSNEKGVLAVRSFNPVSNK